ncbi:MAG: hypothetical protein ABL964_09935 [Steroidobacteraceae bacterium]
MARVIKFEGRNISVPDDATDDEVAQIIGGSSPAAAAPQEASLMDNIVGSIPGRAALGAAGLITGPFQLGANFGDKVADDTFGKGGFRLGEWTNQQLAKIEEMKKRGMAAQGMGEFDLAGLAGSMVGGAGLAKGLKPAVGMGGKILQGMGIGAGAGLAAPVSSGGEDFAAEKAMQVGVGTALGGAAPPVMAGAGSALKGAGHLGDRLLSAMGLEGATRRIADREWGQHVGDDQSRSALVRALQNPKRLVRGSKPTAAEVVSDMPEGLPIAAVQGKIASQITAPKGVSSPATRFSERANSQDFRRETALAARNVMGDKMRDDALNSATGNANSNAIIQDIYRMAQNPDAPPPTQAALVKWASIIDDASVGGTADPRRLYGIRKMINQVLNKTYRGEDDAIKGFTGKELIQIRGRIDDEINAVTGNKWTPYLAEFAKRSKAVSDDVERSKAAKDVVKGLSGAGDTLIDQAGTGVPGMIDYRATILNSVINRAGKKITPKVAAAMTGDALDPKALAAALERAAPSQRQAVITEFSNKYGRGAVQTALATQLGKE